MFEHDYSRRARLWVLDETQLEKIDEIFGYHFGKRRHLVLHDAEQYCSKSALDPV